MGSWLETCGYGLDALNGKPQANVDVEYFCTRPQHNTAHRKVLTNNEGSATFSNPCGDEEEIEISIYPPDKREQCGVGPITLKEIISVGAVAKPDAAGGIWCLRSKQDSETRAWTSDYVRQEAHVVAVSRCRVKFG